MGAVVAASSAIKEPVLCSYCGKPAEFVDGTRLYGRPGEWSSKHFWVCFDCEAWVGCHKANSRYGFEGNEPLGTLANKWLRKARLRVHGVLDPLWQSKSIARTTLYYWLATKLDIPVEECHVGLFDLNRCALAYNAVLEIRQIIYQRTKV